MSAESTTVNENAVRNAVFASENLMAITGRCGHSVPIEDAMEGRDHFACPVCGLRWHIVQEPAKRYPSGFIMPGDRKEVIDAQANLPRRAA